jgi:endoglucanase
LNDTVDHQWLGALTTYLGKNTGAAGMHWTFWCLNPNSGDTEGILKDDWTTVNQEKQDYLTPMEYPIP